jgi:hypothetical protein
MTTKKQEVKKPKQQFDVEKILTNLAGLTALIEGQKIRISKLETENEYLKDKVKKILGRMGL